MELNDRCQKIRAIACDVDGVLTDRKLYIPEQDDMVRSFNVHDGYGIRMWLKMGYEGVLLSGGRSSVLKKRAQMLGIEHLYMADENKLKAYEDFLSKTCIKDEEVCFVADDLFDLPVFERVGLAVAVGDAHFVLKRKAHLVTQAIGGCGAVREAVDRILYMKKAHPYQNYFQDCDFEVGP